VIRTYLLLITACVLLASPFVQAAKVTLTNGKVYQGKTIVKKDILTLTFPGKGGQIRVFQFPITRIVQVQSDNPEFADIVLQATVLRKEDNDRAEPVDELFKGTQVSRLAEKGDWVYVEFHGKDKPKGYIPKTQLSAWVEFTEEEREEAKLRLPVSEIPPPPRITASTVSSASESVQAPMQQPSGDVESATEGIPEETPETLSASVPEEATP